MPANQIGSPVKVYTALSEATWGGLSPAGTAVIAYDTAPGWPRNEGEAPYYDSGGPLNGWGAADSGYSLHETQSADDGASATDSTEIETYFSTSGQCKWRVLATAGCDAGAATAGLAVCVNGEVVLDAQFDVYQGVRSVDLGEVTLGKVYSDDIDQDVTYRFYSLSGGDIRLIHLEMLPRAKRIPATNAAVGGMVMDESSYGGNAPPFRLSDNEMVVIHHPVWDDPRGTEQGPEDLFAITVPALDAPGEPAFLFATGHMWNKLYVWYHSDLIDTPPDCHTLTGSVNCPTLETRGQGFDPLRSDPGGGFDSFLVETMTVDGARSTANFPQRRYYNGLTPLWNSTDEDGFLAELTLAEGDSITVAVSSLFTARVDKLRGQPCCGAI